MATLEEVRDMANQQYSSETIEFDDAPKVSVGTDGTWVQAWVFVNAIPEDCDEDGDPIDEPDFDPENIYNLPGIRQSIEEDRK